MYLTTIAISFLFIIGLMVASDFQDGVIEDDVFTIILFLGVGIMGIVLYKMIRFATDQEKQIEDLK